MGLRLPHASQVPAMTADNPGNYEGNRVQKPTPLKIRGARGVMEERDRPDKSGNYRNKANKNQQLDRESCLTAWYNLIKGNEQRQKVGFKVQKCPLCDKKIPEDAEFRPQCGWDLTDHELAPPQMARIQEEILDARFRAVYRTIGFIAFDIAGLVFIIFSMLASSGVILVQAPWVMSGIAAAFLSVAVAFAFLMLRYHNKQNRLKMMLRDRQPSQ
jgi:hypothetical protein